MLKTVLKTSLSIALLAGATTACQDSPEPPSAPPAPPEPAVESADLVLTNGKIFTVNPIMPWAESVAIKSGKYHYIGEASGLEALIDEETRVIDLGGKMAMPGINDAHVHPMQGSMKDLFECNFPFTATPADIAAAISQCVAERPDAVWIRGGQWGSGRCGYECRARLRYPHRGG